MSNKTLVRGLSAAAILAILTGQAFAAATADENGITPSQWYKFNGSMDQFGSGSVSWGDLGNNYFDSLDGKAISILASGSASPYTDNIKMPEGSWTIVTMAAGKATANPSIIFSNGQGANSGFAIATGAGEENNVIVRAWGTDVVSGYTAEEGATYTDILTATVEDVSAYHLYALSYDSENNTLSLSVDNGTPTSVSGVTYTKRAQAQIGGMHAGGHATVGLSRTAGVLIDDLRVYSQILSADNLSSIKGTFSDAALPELSYSPTVGGGNPTGWLTGWQWDKFDNATKYRPGPDGSSVYEVTEACHPGSSLTPADKRTFAVYANIESMDSSTNPLVILGVGGSTGSNKSVNLVRVGNTVKLAYVNGGAKSAANGIDVTGLKGYHLFVFSYDSAVGTSLSMDGGTPVTDTSDDAKFIPTDGIQMGVTWQGQVYGTKHNGLAVAKLLGFGKVLTPAEITKLASSYPAVTAVDGDLNFNTTGGTMTIDSMTFAANRYLGGSNGTVEVPVGAEVETEQVRFLNTASTSDNVTFNLKGKVTLTKDTDNNNVWSGKTGVLFGHYSGTGTYNITGELDASKTFVELCYTAGAQTINVNGGTIKSKGLWYYGGSPVLKLSNGGLIETTTATGVVAPVEVIGGEGTLKTSESYTNAKTVTVTSGNLNYDVAADKTVTLTGAITGEGTITKKGAGKLVLPSTEVAVVLTEGTIESTSQLNVTAADGYKLTTTEPESEGGVYTYAISASRTVYMKTLTEFVDADDNAVELGEDDVVFIGSKCTIGQWKNGNDLTGLTGHVVIVERHTNIGNGTIGIPEGMHITINPTAADQGVFLKGTVEANAKIGGEGNFFVTHDSASEATIKGGTTISCKTGFQRDGGSATINGNVAITGGFVGVAGTFKLADGATLAVTGGVPEGYTVTTADQTKKVKKTTADGVTTYSIAPQYTVEVPHFDHVTASYTITVGGVESDSKTVVGTSVTVNEGDKIVVTYAADTGWEITGGTNPFMYSNVTGNKSGFNPAITVQAIAPTVPEAMDGGSDDQKAAYADWATTANVTDPTTAGATEGFILGITADEITAAGSLEAAVVAKLNTLCAQIDLSALAAGGEGALTAAVAALNDGCANGTFSLVAVPTTEINTTASLYRLTVSFVSANGQD